ncbi:GatB/YqeY domain-containing protein [Paracoccus sp. R12_1]|uniref:GatB/YqeY domain-containing protein n=1 Tax=unclassified Paracoccus (in: a-proteobacteria) TaxID=2688777 RepID=UPI001ADC224C|nr:MULTISPECIES: GatB/YqeY domain-containing protein [unclassified Paracoccus (in: a-proteobacteria)]MBO9455579.1 GatB/YqeY domain-containing protein [Paracoccus sp. R12_2]MBO9486249.1 GatB/YqeY domain-containing protein [Paracoccus sp. R12_1]
MDLRARLQAATKDAMKSRDSTRLSTLRLIGAAVKDREIALRGGDGEGGEMTEAELVAIMSRMVKQRQESVRAYEEGGRLELAAQEQEEIEIIQEFLPRQLSEAETVSAIDSVISDLGASSIRDMGRVMADLRQRHAGQMDFGMVGPMVKDRLLN